MTDVIVLGAGPAGCTAAKTLAENGRRVLLVERCALPRYKSCSGVLISKTLELVRRYFGEDVPLSARCTPVDNRGMVFTDDRGREYRFEQPGLNVWRGPFDHWLAKRAEACGAELREGTSAVSCAAGPDCVTVTMHGAETYTETARYALNCEGVTGSLRRKQFGDTENITTFQTFNRGSINLDPHYFYAYLQPELSEYDAWFNVKDDLLILGVAVREAGRIPHFYRRFLTYMGERHGLRIERQTKAEKWLMPRVLPGCPVVYGDGRLLYAGETAGFLNPMGEGISAAMESGFHAANAILRYFENPEAVLEDYRQGTAELKTYMERQWRFVAGMAGTFAEMRGICP